jgi:TatA/E family protein of Tat protein translocase
MFGSIGIQEILLILLIALLLFGAKRLPEIGRGLGKGIREFKRTSKEITHQINDEAEEKEKAKNES